MAVVRELPFDGYMLTERMKPMGCLSGASRPTRCPVERKTVEYIPVFGGWQCPSCLYYTRDPDR